MSTNKGKRKGRGKHSKSTEKQNKLHVKIEKLSSQINKAEKRIDSNKKKLVVIEDNIKKDVRRVGIYTKKRETLINLQRKEYKPTVGMDMCVGRQLPKVYTNEADSEKRGVGGVIKKKRTRRYKSNVEYLDEMETLGRGKRRKVIKHVKINPNSFNQGVGGVEAPDDITRLKFKCKVCGVNTRNIIYRPCNCICVCKDCYYNDNNGIITCQLCTTVVEQVGCVRFV